MQFLLVFLLATLSPRCYLPPVEAPISVPFIAPVCTYCPGHRGLEYRLIEGTPVRAVASGIVTFSGLVAGTRYVVVLHDDGIAATYGDLRISSLAAGDMVRLGSIIGASTSTLHFGLRRGEIYLDPADHLGLLRLRARLVPSGGRPGRPSHPPVLQCPATATREGAETAVSPR